MSLDESIRIENHISRGKKYIIYAVICAATILVSSTLFMPWCRDMIGPSTISFGLAIMFALLNTVHAVFVITTLEAYENAQHSLQLLVVRIVLFSFTVLITMIPIDAVVTDSSDSLETCRPTGLIMTEFLFLSSLVIANMIIISRWCIYLQQSRVLRSSLLPL